MFFTGNSIPRWYVLTYLGTHHDALKRLSHIDLPFFAPEFFAQSSENGNRQDYIHSTSYAFVHGTQNQIYDLKRQGLRSFNFLPKTQGNNQEHPFVEDYVIDQLRKVEEVNDGKIPYMPYPTDVVVGDTIRILVGQFEGLQAKAITRNGSKYRQVILDIAGKFVIPLCKLKVGEYEIISYNDKDDKTTSANIREEDISFLYEALKRHHGIEQTDQARRDEDISLVTAISLRYRNAISSTHQQRVKVSVLLAMAYTVLDDEEEQRHYVGHTINLLEGKCSSALKAKAYCALYACTFNEEYFNQYLSVKQTIKESKDMKSIIKIEEKMDFYRQWYLKHHPRKSRYTLVCQNPDIGWFAIETSFLEDTINFFVQNDITTYDPSLTAKNGMSILLVRSTFEQLQDIQSNHPSFDFLRENNNGQLSPLQYDDAEVDDYRYLLNAMPDAIQHIELTPDYDAILARAKRTTYLLDNRALSGIISTHIINNIKQRRFILNLRHLGAIAIPYSNK